MKKLFNKDILFWIIIGVIISNSIRVVATYLYESNQISYVPQDIDWKVENVNTALDDLYNEIVKNNNIKKDFKMTITGTMSVGSGCEDDVGANTIKIEITYIDGTFTYPTTRYSSSWESACGAWRVGYLKITDIQIEYI